jgi:hypothetical protein
MLATIGDVWPFSSNRVTAVWRRSCYRAFTPATFFACAIALRLLNTGIAEHPLNDPDVDAIGQQSCSGSHTSPR